MVGWMTTNRCSGARVKGHRVCNPCLKSASTTGKEPATPERSKILSPPQTPMSPQGLSSPPSIAEAIFAAGPTHECKEAELREQISELSTKLEIEKKSAEESLNRNVALVDSLYDVPL
jgi:hypothetical protein